MKHDAMLGMALAMGLSAGMANAQPARAPAAAAVPISESSVTVSDNNATRAVDCGGRNLTVVGSGDTLKVSNCLGVTVVGNQNRITAKLLPDSTITALGDRNHVVFSHAPGYEVPVRSSGAHNEIVTQ